MPVRLDMMQPTRAIEQIAPGDVVLDPIQRHFVEQIDPSYVNTQERSQSMLEQLGQTSLLERLRAGLARTDGLPADPFAIPAPEEAAAVGSGSNVEGGFAFGALLPLLTPLVGPLINGIASLFKPRAEGRGIAEGNGSRGAGSRAPNAFGSGSGAPNGRGELSYVPVSKDVLLDRQRSLIGRRGRAFWDELIGQAENALMEGLINSGDVTPEQARAIASELLANVVPPSFTEFIRNSPKAPRPDKTEVKGGMTLGSVVKPLMKWGTSRLLSDYQNPDIRTGIHKYGDELNARWLYGTPASKSLIGSGRASDWFRKILGYAKKGLAAVLPMVGQVAKQLAPGAIDSVMSEFNLTNDPVASTIARIARSAIVGKADAKPAGSGSAMCEARPKRRTIASNSPKPRGGSKQKTEPAQRGKIHRVAGFRLEALDD